jgi:hypothetical protein
MESLPQIDDRHQGRNEGVLLQPGGQQRPSPRPKLGWGSTPDPEELNDVKIYRHKSNPRSQRRRP